MNIPVWRWCAREQFDAVFVHMNADWVYRLAPCWRRFGVPVLLWYAHGSVTRRLHRAHEHASCVITLNTRKDSGFPRRRSGSSDRASTPTCSCLLRLAPTCATIVAVGRVSRRKRVDLMLESLAWLKAHAPQHPFTLRIIGPTLTRDDERYAEELAKQVAATGWATRSRSKARCRWAGFRRSTHRVISALEPERNRQHGQGDSRIAGERLPDRDEQRGGIPGAARLPRPASPAANARRDRCADPPRL